MRTDEDIKKDVVDAMYWDDRVDASKVGVAVDGGVVRLTGAVSSYRERAAAEDDARVIRGVTGIDNLIVVAYPPAVELPQDADILAELSDRLDRDPDIDASNVMGTVEDGWVTLDGSVASYWEKEIAESVAGAVMGVVGVTNKLAVVPEHDVEDELVADDIVAALDRNAIVDIEDVDVGVTDGVVTLRGRVPSWYVRHVVVGTAQHTGGVVDVDDRLLVGERAPAGVEEPPA